MSVDFKQSFNSTWETIISWLPTVLIVLIILLVGWIVAIAARLATRKLLELAGVNRHLAKTKLGDQINQVLGGVSNFFGKIVYWLVWLGTAGVAASRLNLQPVTDLVNAVYGYLPNILAALAIFIAAVVVSDFAKKVIQRVLGATPTGNIVSTVVPVIVMSIAGFMILNQLQLAPEIINITYGALMGALALGLALSFGLGGREVAARILEGAYDQGQKQIAQAKTDWKQTASGGSNGRKSKAGSTRKS